MKELEEKFFEDLCRHVEKWSDAAVKAVERPSTATWADSAEAFQRLNAKGWTAEDLKDLKATLIETADGVLHSTLVSIDGGSALASFGRLELIDAGARSPLSDGALHEDFAEYQAQHGLI